MRSRPGHYGIALVGGILLIALLILIAGLEEPLVDAAADMVGYGGVHSDEATGSRDLFHSGVPIGGHKHGETYGTYDRRRDAGEVGNHFNFGCPGGDCRSHEAGYSWAVRGRIVDPGDCTGSTWEFVEGCAAYVLKQE